MKTTIDQLKVMTVIAGGMHGLSGFLDSFDEIHNITKVNIGGSVLKFKPSEVREATIQEVVKFLCEKKHLISVNIRPDLGGIVQKFSSKPDDRFPEIVLTIQHTAQDLEFTLSRFGQSIQI